MLENLNNYYCYVPLVQFGTITINTADINDGNLDNHFIGILNIFRDGIESDQVQNMIIHIIFTDGIEIDLSVFDYFYNLIFWKLATIAETPISSLYLFFPEDITKKEIKWYIDHMFVKLHRKDIPFMKLNNAMDDAMYKFKYINEFSLYLANTVNLEDTIELMNQYKEFYDAVHADLSNVPIEDVKNEGMKLANLQIKYIKNSNHCLRDSFRAAEAINPKQYKEVAVNIGSKPDGAGGVFPMIINTSFMTGGVRDPESYLIESAVGRTAQILQKMNVGISGSFARLLELNNIDTILNPDPDYACNTKNFEVVKIDSAIKLNMYDMRYFKFNPKGPDYVVNAETDSYLIGQTLYFRSPMTCSSFASGHGICRKCYGDLYFINKDINVGKIAAELLSSDYTQKMLSAKHLLESLVVKMDWTEGFKDLFAINFNTIALNGDIDYSGYKMHIGPFSNEDENDDISYNEYVSSFDIEYPDGTIVNFHTTNSDSIYISEELNMVLSAKAEIRDDVYYISLDALKDLSILFLMHIKNNELSRTLERSKAIINKNDETKMFDKDTILEEFMNVNIEGGINLDAIHMEILLANQFRSADDVLEKPDWSRENEPYQILTLGGSLTNNPSITVTLEYQKVAQTLVSPLSSRKKKPSFLDIYFMEQPQKSLENTASISDNYQPDQDEERNKVEAISFIEYPKDECE